MYVGNFHVKLKEITLNYKASRLLLFWIIYTFMSSLLEESIVFYNYNFKNVDKFKKMVAI